MTNTTKSQVNPNVKYYKIPSKSQLNPFLLEKEKHLRKRKTRLKYLFGKAFLFKERFLVVLEFGICLVVLVLIGIWDFQDKEALTQK